jgi:ribosome biogenesis GTPase A
MQESYRSDDLSFLDDSGHNPLAPIKVENNFQRNPVFYNSRATANKTSNRIITLLSANKSTNKLEFNEEFQDYLALDEANSNLNVVTFVGSKSVGKSFLIDFLISKEEKSSSRLLSKNSKGYISMPTYEIKGKNG